MENVKQFKTRGRPAIRRLFALVVIGLLALMVACFTTADQAPSPTPEPLRELRMFIEPRDCASYILDPQPEEGSKYLQGTGVTISLVPDEDCRVKEWINVDSYGGLTGRVNLNADRIVQINLERLPDPTLTPPFVAQPTNTPEPVASPAATIPSPTSTPAPTPTPAPTLTPTPTPTLGQASSGYKFNFQFVCVNRTLKQCELLAAPGGMTDRIWERTNGQVNILISSFPELGLNGIDTLRLIENGTLGMAEVYSGYIGDDVPSVEISNLWGLVSDTETNLNIVDAVREPVHEILEDRLNAVVLAEIYYPGQHFFTVKPLRTKADFDGMNIRIHNELLNDLIPGMGAQPQWVPFAEVYTALERGVLDAALTCGICGLGQRWYEVSNYLVGPLASWGVTYITVNQDQWDEIPADLQAIMREEALKHQEANRRLLDDWTKEGIDENVARGMEYIEFTPEVKDALRQAAMDKMIPAWVIHAGGPDSDAVKMFNTYVAPILGISIDANGRAVE